VAVLFVGGCKETVHVLCCPPCKQAEMSAADHSQEKITKSEYNDKETALDFYSFVQHFYGTIVTWPPLPEEILCARKLLLSQMRLIAFTWVKVCQSCKHGLVLKPNSRPNPTLIFKSLFRP